MGDRMSMRSSRSSRLGLREAVLSARRWRSSFARLSESARSACLEASCAITEGERDARIMKVVPGRAASRVSTMAGEQICGWNCAAAIPCRASR